MKRLTAASRNKGREEKLRILPRGQGECLIIDEKNERIVSTRIRPRSTWNGGEAPIAIKEEKKIF